MLISPSRSTRYWSQMHHALEIYQRGSSWWVRGRVEYQGVPITDYYRRSIGPLGQSQARRWADEEEERQIRKHLFGEENSLTFSEAILLYNADAKTAEYLTPLVPEIGKRYLSEISPQSILDLGPKLMPDASTDTWIRQIVTPVRSVMNNAHHLGKGPAISIKGYSNEERIRQDKRRGKKSRVKKQPGSWEWLLRFRQHAPQRHAALALFMFATGARISQAIEMHPDKHLKLDMNMACVPGAKGHDDRWLTLPKVVVDELKALPELYPRGWDKKDRDNLRVFGFADRSSPRKGWTKACDEAGIPVLGFHAAGSHGFGQEMNVRQRIDEKAAGAFGGWSDTNLMKRVYTHEEETAGKIHDAFQRGLEKAQEMTGLNLKVAESDDEA